MAKDKTEEVEVKAKKSEARLAYEAIIEAYKVSNPVKYELKKEALNARLEAIE